MVNPGDLEGNVKEDEEEEDKEEEEEILLVPISLFSYRLCYHHLVIEAQMEKKAVITLKNLKQDISINTIKIYGRIIFMHQAVVVCQCLQCLVGFLCHCFHMSFAC